MPLFQLPFHLGNVAQGVVAGFSVGIVLTLLTFLADREVWPFRSIADLFMRFRMATVEETKRFTLFKKIIYSLAGLFFAMGLFYGLVLVGIIQDGTPPPVPTIDEFIRMQRGMGK